MTGKIRKFRSVSHYIAEETIPDRDTVTMARW